MAKSGKKPSASRTDLRNSLADALFAAAREHGWRDLDMAAIAKAAGCSTAEARTVATSATDLLGHAIRRADGHALGEVASFEEQDTVRDRLFALLMARFDALAPHRDGIRSIVRSGLADPTLHVLVLSQGLCSMNRMLEAAGLPATGPFNMIRAKGLAMVNAHATRVWLEDDSPDAGKTMKALDRDLARAESLARILDPDCCRRNNTPTT